MSRRLIIVPLLLLGFPLGSFIALQGGHAPLLWLAAPDAVITAGVLAGWCAPGGWRVRIATGALASLICLWALRLWPDITLSVFPILVNVIVAHIFSRSLVPGREALITRIAKLERGGVLPEALAIYTQRLTSAWAWFFRMLALNGVFLALTASAETILLFANTLNLVLIAAFFLAEYLYRRWRFRAYGHPPLRHLIRTLADTGWMRQGHEPAAPPARTAVER